MEKEEDITKGMKYLGKEQWKKLQRKHNILYWRRNKSTSRI